MNSTSSLKWSLFFILMTSFNVLVSAHSQMRCAKYDKATRECHAPIRNQGVSYVQEAYSFTNGAPICQSPMSNPISASYANGAGCPDWAGCPSPMGTYTPGETFTVMWFARNHAEPNQNPDTVFLYLSPAESQTQGADVSQAVMESRKICQGPFMNCNGQNGDQVHCTLTCTMPTNLVKGVYTMWWKWIWQGGATYTTCADIQVNVESSGVTPSPSPPPAAITTGKVNTVKPVTTGKVIPPVAVTTGRTQANPGRITTSRAAAASTSTSTSTSTSGTAVVSTGSPSTVTGNTSPSNKRCTYGEMRCTSPNTYQSCGYSQDGKNDWTASQACANGLVCSASFPYIYCTRS